MKPGFRVQVGGEAPSLGDGCDGARASFDGGGDGRIAPRSLAPDGGRVGGRQAVGCVGVDGFLDPLAAEFVGGGSLGEGQRELGPDLGEAIPDFFVFDGTLPNRGGEVRGDREECSQGRFGPGTVEGRVRAVAMIPDEIAGQPLERDVARGNEVLGASFVERGLGQVEALLSQQQHGLSDPKRRHRLPPAGFRV